MAAGPGQLADGLDADLLYLSAAPVEGVKGVLHFPHVHLGGQHLQVEGVDALEETEAVHRTLQHGVHGGRDGVDPGHRLPSVAVHRVLVLVGDLGGPVEGLVQYLLSRQDGG